MARTKRVSQEPILLDLYAGFALVGVLQQHGNMAPEAFVAHKAFELAKSMIERRNEILAAESKDE